jgi:glycosyltransferase involved in cell wall biosynthesis
MAITEALAAHCPAVVTEECNFDELEKLNCGVIIRNGDMTAFTRAVEDLLNDGPRREAFGAAGASFVNACCTWDKVACDLERVYRHILSGSPLPADGRPTWR